MKQIRFRSLLPPIPKIARLTCFGAVTAGALWVAGPRDLAADSIWARRDYRSAFLFVDTRGRRIGDLLTVRIQEVTGIDEEDERTLEKQTDSDGSFTFSGTSTSGDITRNASAAFSANQESNRTLGGSSEFESDRSFTDQITVTVVDILPNRNLVIEGVRTREIAGDNRIMRVSGIIRPDDIELGNFVLSPKIANFKITYEGTGPSIDYNQHGWFGKIMTKLWPF